MRGLNPRARLGRPGCYHYINPAFLADSEGFAPSSHAAELSVIAIYTTNPFLMTTTFTIVTERFVFGFNPTMLTWSFFLFFLFHFSARSWIRTSGSFLGTRCLTNQESLEFCP